MTKQTRRKFRAEFRAKVALEAIKNQKTLTPWKEVDDYFKNYIYMKLTLQN